MRTLLALLLLILSAVAAAAQSSGSPGDTARSAPSSRQPATPFGFRMGMSLSDIRARFSATPVEGSPGAFRLTSAPATHPEFESYLLVFSPSQGLCKVVGIGRNFETSDFGTQVRSHYENIKNALVQRYGPGEEYDYVRAGSLWEESRYFMMGLSRGDRTLQTFWIRQKRPDLPENISAIGVQAKAASIREAYINVSYEFSNFERCTAEREQSQNSVF
jgi:hypothetical protein